MKKDIKSSEYLYGIQPCHFSNLTYKGALKEKIKYAKELLSKLLDEPDWVMNIRVKHVKDAIEFNEYLLNELKECNG